MKAVMVAIKIKSLDIGRLKDMVWQVMQANRRHSRGYSYTVPSPDSYPFQWFWDSCFHAIILRHFEPALAKQELRALTAHQFKNGMIPHMVYWEKIEQTKFPKINWGKRHTSSLTQPPMLAAAVWAVYQVDGDKAFLREMLPAINRLHHYFLAYRDPYKHRLIGLINPDESGEDNSPRFDKALHLHARHKLDKNYQSRLGLIEKYRRERFVIKHNMDQFHWVRDVPINAILVANLRYQSYIAAVLGESKITHASQGLAGEVSAAMRQYMLQDGIMYSTVGLDYQPIKIKTWAMFAPLFGELHSQAEAESLVERHLLNPKEFKAPYMLPTVAMDEPSFDPAGFWRGPVWIATNWFIFKGLLNYNLGRTAEPILNDSLRLVSQSGLREQFNPLTGAGMGAANFTWGGLVLDMLSDLKT